MGSRSIRETVAAKPALAIDAVGRRRGRSREKRVRRELPRPVADMAPAPAPDAVRIAVLAIESLGRASMRACFTGTEVRVAVPDALTAAIFRAAIAETSRTRATDRLIRIVVD